MGIMVTYGSYAKKETNLMRSINQIEWFDTAVALLAGLMIESPEPIHRPGRLTVSLALKSAAGGETSFDIGRSDRSGSRLIHLASRPFQVNDPLGGFAQFMLRARSWLGTEVVDLRGMSTVPRRPAFWEDPS
mgnify:CR=1 FL=1